LQNRHFTHPMREDVKRKHFSTPLRETSIVACIQAPFFFVERILGLTPRAQHSTTDVNRLLVFLEWFHVAVPTPFVAKLHKLTVGLSANHHPM
jgi:hypothetical protein